MYRLANAVYILVIVVITMAKKIWAKRPALSGAAGTQEACQLRG